MKSTDAALSTVLGEETLRRVQNCKLLVVGAGGIGCELLKNLVQMSFNNIVVIDLDTIDISNLNRQFLFRPHHVGKSKAEVARESILRFNPHCNIVAHHANIMEPEYNVKFYEGFDVVINALDNVAARSYVNRMCHLACRPLIEAGTKGLDGQAYPIIASLTQCFECTAKPVQTQYPICTIRSTPDKPVHCIVWAKELFKLLVGARKESSLYESDTLTSGGNAESVYMSHVNTPIDYTNEDNIRSYIKSVFDAIFDAEIRKRLEIAMESYVIAGRVPRPISLDAALAGTLDSLSSDLLGTNSPLPGTVNSSTKKSKNSHALMKDQVVPSVRECAELFVASLEKYLTLHAESMKASEESNTKKSKEDEEILASRSLGNYEFSKDEPLDLDFVVAAANLRAATFGIPLLSRFDVKSIAGNIIPAVATTNAIVAALQVVELVKLLEIDVNTSFQSGTQGKSTSDSLVTMSSPKTIDSLRYTVCQKVWPGSCKQALMTVSLQRPNACCPQCSLTVITVGANCNSSTLDDLLSFISSFTGVTEPNLNNGRGLDFVEDEDDDTETKKMLQKMKNTPLAQLPGGGIVDSSLLLVIDQLEDIKFRLLVLQDDNAIKGMLVFDRDAEIQLYSIRKEAERKEQEAQLHAVQASIAAANSLNKKNRKRRRDEDDEIVILDSDVEDELDEKSHKRLKNDGKVEEVVEEEEEEEEVEEEIIELLD